MSSRAATLLVVGAALVLAGPTASATKASAFARSVSCRAAEVTIDWNGRAAVVSRSGTTLARATVSSRSVSRTCAKIGDLPMYRQGLEETARGSGRVTCRPGPYVRIEVDPLRTSAGRIVGSRLAVFVSGWRVESAEAFITKTSRWFSWSPISCHSG